MSDNLQKIKKLAANVRENPEDSFLKFALALELLKNNQDRKALLLFESVYKNHPDYLGVYYHLGKLYESLENYERAEQLFTEGIRVAQRQDKDRTEKELNEALEALKEDRNHETR
ncbi:MAG: tetratricopeptide repeat protein [Balneolaceae bacterium]